MLGQQRSQDVRVGGRRTGHVVIDQAGFTRPVGKLGGVDEIAVVSQGQSGARGGVAKYRLSVLPRCRTGGRIAAVSDRDVTRHGTESLFVEHLTDQPEILEDQHLGTVGDRDPGGLLAAVLQGVQAVVGKFGDFLAGGPDAEDAAFFPRWIFQLAGHDDELLPDGVWAGLALSLRPPAAKAGIESRRVSRRVSRRRIRQG